MSESNNASELPSPYTPFVLLVYLFRGCLTGRAPRRTKTLVRGRFAPQRGGLRSHPDQGTNA
jgi:hypothetical protein